MLYICIIFSISLDPEEDMQDADLFSMLGTFLNKDLDPVEREQVFTKTIPRMVERAKDLKCTKPPQGLHFSLQQQGIAITRFDILPDIPKIAISCIIKYISFSLYTCPSHYLK